MTRVFDLENMDPYFFQKNAYINASAGTGKTHTIQNLVCKMIESDGKNLVGGKPITISEILLVTFTEKAASELKTRIRDILEERLQKGAIQDVVRKRISIAIQNMDTAPIHTIHSFCQKILASYGFEANTGFESTMASDEGVRSFIEKICRDEWPKDSLFQTLVAQDAFNFEKAIGILTQLVNKYNPETTIIGDPALDVNADLEALQIPFEKLVETKLAASKSVLGNEDYQDFQEALEKYKAGEKKTPFSGKLGPKKIEKAAESNPTLAQCFCDLKIYDCSENDFHKQIAKRLGNHFLASEADKIYDRFQTYKKENSVLSFDDLIISLYSALKSTVENPLLEVLRKHYRYGIIDEFQDTNEIQWSIFKRIFLESEHNCLFVVGDPKQSIYAFQGANLAVYQRALKEIANYKKREGEGYRLPKNYRSSRMMIAACNSLFTAPENASVWFSKEGDIPFQDSEVGKTSDSYQATFKGQSIKPIWITPDIVSPFTHALWCLEQIKQCFVLDNEGKTALQIPEKADHEEFTLRNVKFSDIAVLARNRKEMNCIEALFRKNGIPFTRYKDTGLFSDSECAHWIALLQAINAKNNDQKKLRAALLTRFFNYSFEDAEVFDFENARNTHFTECLTYWREKAERREWPRLIHSILEKSEIEQTLFHPETMQELAKFRQIGDYIVEVLCQQSISLSSMARHLDNLRNGIEEIATEDGDFIATETDSEVIQVMTIHASKGLQFPIVVLVGGNGEGLLHQDIYTFSERESTQRILTLDGDYITTQGTKAKEKNAVEDVAEWKRLFYVALTRAEHLLLMPQFPQTRNNSAAKFSPYGKFLGKAIDALKNKSEYCELRNIETPERAHHIFENYRKHQIQKEALEESALFDLKKQQNALLEKLNDIKNNRPQKLYSISTSYSKIAHGESHINAEGRNDKAEEVLPTPEPTLPIIPETETIPPCFDDADYPKGSQIGNTIHEVLEVIDFREGMEEQPTLKIREKIAKQLQSNGIESSPTFIDQTATLISHTLRAKLPKVWEGNAASSFILGEIPAGDRCHEMQFNKTEKIDWFMNGFIDLLFRIKDDQGKMRWCILDWKSNKIESYDSKSIEISMKENNYNIQRALYAYVVIEWLASLRGIHDNIGKAKLFDEEFGGVYYAYVRGCHAGTSHGFSISRYESYQKLQEDVQKEVLSRLHS